MKSDQSQTMFKACQDLGRTWTGLCIALAETGEKTARAGFDLHRQAMRGESVNIDAFFNELDAMAQQVDAALADAAEAMPLWAGISQAPERFRKPEYRDKAEELARQVLDIQMELIRYGASTAQEGARLFVDQKALNQAIMDIDAQLEENWDCAHDVMKGWLDFARKTVEALSSKALPMEPFELLKPFTFRQPNARARTDSRKAAA